MKQLQKIKRDNIVLGMKFSAPVFFDDGENMFLAENKPVLQYHIDALKKWNIPFVLTYGIEILDGQNVSDELEEIDAVENLDDLEELGEVEELENDDPTSDIVKVYNSVVKNMQTVFANFNKSIPVQRSIVDSMSETIYEMVYHEKNAAMSFILNRGQSNGLAYSAVNIAIMSAVIALKMEYTKRKVLIVIASALFHDMCMLSVPEKIVNKKDKLSHVEFEQLKMHTFNAARYLTENLLLPREIGNIVKQHHEKWDGSGYPEGRKGRDIELSARIISITDAFEAMVTDKSYRNSVTGYEAVKAIIAGSGKQYDPDVVKCFIETVGVYPVGSNVILNDSSIATVVQPNPENPLLPVVKIICGKNDVGGEVKLAEQKALFIVKTAE